MVLVVVEVLKVVVLVVVEAFLDRRKQQQIQRVSVNRNNHSRHTPTARRSGMSGWLRENMDSVCMGDGGGDGVVGFLRASSRAITLVRFTFSVLEGGSRKSVLRKALKTFSVVAGVHSSSIPPVTPDLPRPAVDSGPAVSSMAGSEGQMRSLTVYRKPSYDKDGNV